MTLSTIISIIHLREYPSFASGGERSPSGGRKWLVTTARTRKYTITSPASCERTACWGISGPRPRDCLQFTGTRRRTQRAPGWSPAQRLQSRSQGPSLPRNPWSSGDLDFFEWERRCLQCIGQGLSRVFFGHVYQWDFSPLVRPLSAFCIVRSNLSVNFIGFHWSFSQLLYLSEVCDNRCHSQGLASVDI